MTNVENLKKHVENIQYFGLPLIVALNKFPNDSDKDVNLIAEFCKKRNIEY